MSAARRSAAQRAAIGRRLAEARLGGSRSLREVAEGAGVHQNDIARWERGEQAPPVGYVAYVADAYDVSCDWLLGRADHPRPAAAIPAGAVPARVLRDAITLTHPDLHPEGRQARATRVTQELNALLDAAR